MTNTKNNETLLYVKNGGEHMKIWDKLRILSRKKGILSWTINIAYALLVSPYFQFVTSIVFSSLIAFYINMISGVMQTLTTSKTMDKTVQIVNKSIDANGLAIEIKQYYWTLGIIILIYFLLQIGIIIANNKQRSKLKDIIWFHSAIASHGAINAFIANSLYKFTKRFLQQKRENNMISLEITKDLIGFQTFAFAVCNDIYKILNSELKCEKPQVTVFQKFDDAENKKFIQMVAYSCYKDNIPSSYSEKYYFADVEVKRKRCDEKIFSGKEASVKVFADKKSIVENFYISENSKEREEAICQYIGVPIKDSSGEIVFLLQIDVNQEGVLGKSELELKELAENVIFPYAQILYACYEKERMMEMLYKNVHII